MNKQYLYVRFLTEAENKVVLPFSCIKIYRENGKFVTGDCRKDTFNSAYKNVTSFILHEYTFALLCICFHCFILGSSKFQMELEKLKKFKKKFKCLPTEIY